MNYIWAEVQTVLYRCMVSSVGGVWLNSFVAIDKYSCRYVLIYELAEAQAHIYSSRGSFCGAVVRASMLAMCFTAVWFVTQVNLQISHNMLELCKEKQHSQIKKWSWSWCGWRSLAFSSRLGRTACVFSTLRWNGYYGWVVKMQWCWRGSFEEWLWWTGSTCSGGCGSSMVGVQWFVSDSNFTRDIHIPSRL
jgi:hypothetical protein